MRAIVLAWLIIVTALFACEEHGSRIPDATIPPDAPGACAPSGGCADGPMCNGVCCGPGEACEAGICRCGSTPACTGGDMCFVGGPIAPVELPCGRVCCGGPSPCPI
jgi:hypothetical protein